jgi:hypothetical protein
MKFLKYFFGAIAMILLAIAFGWVVMWLWNALIPQLFGGPILNWTQAVGILVLARLLTGGFGRGWGHSRCGHHRHGGWKSHRNEHWKQRWQKKMSNMSPEERDRCKAKMKRWCGDWEEEPESCNTEPTGSQEEPKN